MPDFVSNLPPAREQFNYAATGALAGGAQLMTLTAWDFAAAKMTAKPMQINQEVLRPGAYMTRSALRFFGFDIVRTYLNQNDLQSPFWKGGISGAAGGWLESRIGTLLKIMPAPAPAPAHFVDNVAMLYLERVKATVLHCSKLFVCFGWYDCNLPLLGLTLSFTQMYSNVKSVGQPKLRETIGCGLVAGAIGTFAIDLMQQLRSFPNIFSLKMLQSTLKGSLSIGSVIGVQVYTVGLLQAGQQQRDVTVEKTYE